MPFRQQQGQARDKYHHSYEEQLVIAFDRREKAQPRAARRADHAQDLGRGEPPPGPLHIDDLGLRRRGRLPLGRIRGRSGCVPLPDQLVHAHPEQVGQLDELIQLGHRLARLPLAHRLPRHLQPFRQVPLGQLLPGAQL